jgi:hypothetical protein
MTPVQRLTSQFIAQIEGIVAERVQAKLGEIISSTVTGTIVKPRRKAPAQLCPSPGCKERAAPVFSMLCSAHKDAPAKTVASWRAARRAGKSSRA